MTFNQRSGPEEGKAGDLVTFARGELLRRIAAAEERVWLASPFLTAPIAKQICAVVAAGERRLLTALEPDGVQVGALSPTALTLLSNGGFAIRSCTNLHAKVSLVDSSWGLVGSGNLTNAGLGSTSAGNEELGVLLTATQIAAAAEIFSGWWETATPVTAAMIADYAKLPKLKRVEVAAVGSPLALPQTEALEQILAEDATTAASRRYWIKSAFHQPADERWWTRNWISDAAPARYEVDDLIFIYLTKQRGRGPGKCPALVRVTAPTRHDPQWMADHGDGRARGQWPYVTETAVVAEVPVPAGVEPRVAERFAPQRYCEITRPQFELLALAMQV